MEVFEVVRNIPEAERLTEKPISPMPTCHGAGTKEEWDAYWINRDNYYHGLQLQKVYKRN